MSFFLIMIAPILAVFISLAVFFIWGLYGETKYDTESETTD